MKNNDMMTNQIQHSKTSRTSRLFALVLAFLCSMLIAGCRADAPFGEEEKNTPTGCLKSQGRYYDPQLKECVKVTNQHQAMVLNAYRYVNELVEKDAGVIEYSIYPRTYLTIEEAEVLWADLRKDGAKMVVLSGQMPDNREYDKNFERQNGNQGGSLEKLKTWGVEGAALHLGWSERSGGIQGTISEMFYEGLLAREKEGLLTELRTAITEYNDLRVGYLHIRADAKDMRDWWNRHLESIEGVQPLVDTLDKSMPAYGPRGALKEGE